MNDRPLPSDLNTIGTGRGTVAAGTVAAGTVVTARPDLWAEAFNALGTDPVEMVGAPFEPVSDRIDEVMNGAVIEVVTRLDEAVVWLADGIPF
jgi:hypothetical protein